MTGTAPRLKPSEIRLARSAGLLVPDATKASFFGSMFSWFPTVRFGRESFWPISGNSKPPVNAAQGESGIIVTPASAMTLSAVWACVWLNARTMASMPLELKRYAANGAGKLELDDPLYEVLRWRPNAKMTAYEFWVAMWAGVLLWGTGYAYKQRIGARIVGLDPLRPEFMTVYQKESGEVRYRYDDPRAPDDFAADDVFVLRERTLDGISGASVVEFARNSMSVARSGELAASRTFKKGLNASGFLKVDKFLKKAQREEFQASIEEFAGDGPKSGGTMVLEGGVGYQQLSMKPLDAELLASRQFSVEDVCRWFSTPPILIGHASAGQTMWGSGVEQIFSGWLRLSLRGYVEAAQQAVRASLIRPADRAELYAEYDLDQLLAPDSQARSTLYSTQVQNGLKTRNEIREKEGDPAMEGGDQLTIQSNLMSLAQLDSQNSTGGGTQAAQKLRDALLEFMDAGESSRRNPVNEVKP